MNEYEKADLDVIRMCNEHKRRSDITTTIGYIIPQEEAMEYAAITSAKKRGGIGFKDISLICLATLAVICIPIVILICEIIK